MGQKHLDRLSAIDASFLSAESETSHMHVGAALIFEGPPPSYEQLAEHISSRLHLVPRFRQKLAFPPLESGRPVWVDDPNFNIEYHLRHSALPSPGGISELRRLTTRIFSQQLDRAKPLWELYLVQGLEDNRFGVISKTHHAMIDGVSGVDITAVLFDVEPVPQDPEPPEHDWVPSPEPSTPQLVVKGVRDAAGTPLRVGRQLLDAARSPQGTVQNVREATEAIGEVAWAYLNPAPEVPLNQPGGPHRRFTWVSAELADFKHIKDALGGTVNDAVLSVVSGALRRWLKSRGVRTAGLELRALVPVSIRTDSQANQLGNQIAAMRGPLPVYIENPVKRLEAVSREMEDLKASKQALGAEVIASFNNFAPPTILAQASRLNFSTRLFNLIVTNVPGPQIPLYLVGRELQELIPVAFLPDYHNLAIAIMSYNGGVSFGLLADYDNVADIGILAEGIEQSLGDLLAAADDVAGEPGPDYEEWTREELYELAQERDVPGRSNMAKAELIMALREYQVY